MAAGADVQVEVHWLDESPDTFVVGEWCDRCLLPSIWTCRVVIAHRSRPDMVIARGTYVRCTSCSASLFTPLADGAPGR